MDGQMIETLKRAYVQALAEAKRYNKAADGIAEVIRAAEGAPIVHAGATNPLGIKDEKAEAANERGKPATEAAPAAAHPWRIDKRKAAAKAKKAVKAKKETLWPRECVVCGKVFVPRRRDQLCCSPACGKQKTQADTAAKRQAAKAPAAPKAPAKAPTAATAQPAGNPSRLERIRALAGGGTEIPRGVAAAAAEARESEDLN